jgi:O-succinylbenzoate synthase
VFTFAIAMTQRFRGIVVREGVLIEGDAGWGEFSPFWTYSPAQCVAWLRAAREAANSSFPAAKRQHIPVNVTVPAVDPATATRIVHGSQGCRTAKVKVAEPGQNIEHDADRLAAVREALGHDGAIRIDANGAWDVRTALDSIARLESVAGGLEYVEQPCASIDDLARVRARVSKDILIAADESVRLAADPLDVVRREAADVLVLKVQPLGGVLPCLDIAVKSGLPVVVSSAIETSVGLSAGIALAAALDELPFACGLATMSLLKHDVTDSPLEVTDGCIEVKRVAPDMLGDDCQSSPVHADEDVRARWAERMRAVEDLL